MNKQGFVDAIASKAGLTKKDARKVLDTVIDVITENLAKNEPVFLTGFGKFEVRARKESRRINPQTGQRFNVPAKVVPTFKPGKTLKDIVAKRLRVIRIGSKLKVR